MLQQKRLFTVGLSIVGIGIIGLAIIYNYNNKIKNNVNDTFEEKSKISREKDVAGIVDYTLVDSDNSLEYTSEIAYRDIDNMQKECIVIEIKNIDTWNALEREKQSKIMKGLINTSRLQVDKLSGCVVVEYLDMRVSEGSWEGAKGYVIINK